MQKTTREHAADCCATAHARLLEDLRRCDYCSDDFARHTQCRQTAARKSGKRARQCVTR